MEKITEEIVKRMIKETFKGIFWVVVILTITMYWYDQYLYYFTDTYSSDDYYHDEYDDNDEYLSDSIYYCPDNSNVALIRIRGDIVTYPYYFEESEDSDITSSEEIVFYIDKINKDSYILALIVEIDSYGGYPVASEEIMNALKRLEKPTIALIREGAASGAYLIATGTDKIYASEVSDIGSIGITMSYLDYSEWNKKEGIIYQQLSSGIFKDSGDEDKALTKAEKELFMRDINIMHDIFVRRVAENRNLDIRKVEKLADGSTMLGQAAKDNGLIDEIGNIYDVKDWIKEELGIEPVICNY
jgi:protease IV